MGKDVYGDVTYIKAYAASDSNSTYTLEGSSPVDADGQTYEAEYASLFGASTDTQASVNQNHSGYSGAGFVDKLEAAGAGVTFYAKVANAGDYDVTFRVRQWRCSRAVSVGLCQWVLYRQNHNALHRTLGHLGGLPDAASAGGRKQHHHS